MGLALLTSTASAQEPGTHPHELEIHQAKVAYDAAVLDLHRYRFVEYPREVRSLEHAIRVRKAEIEAIERRMADWEPFNRWRNGQILSISVEHARISIAQLKYEVADMEAELFDLHRRRAETIRLLLAQVDRQASRLRAMEAL